MSTLSSDPESLVKLKVLREAWGERQASSAAVNALKAADNKIRGGNPGALSDLKKVLDHLKKGGSRQGLFQLQYGPSVKVHASERKLINEINTAIAMKPAAFKMWLKTGAGGMRIGPSGLEQPSKIYMQPNTIYYLGASSSPDMIIVTKVDDKTITFKKYPFEGGGQRIERWIGEDLIARGSKTWLSSGYVKYNPEVARSLKSMLAGKPGKKVNPKDYERVTVRLELDPSVDFNDGYTFVKNWGVLTGTPQDTDKDYWQVEMQRGDVKELKKDRKVKKVISAK